MGTYQLALPSMHVCSIAVEDRNEDGVFVARVLNVADGGTSGHRRLRVHRHTGKNASRLALTRANKAWTSL
jgi:hypothetical protein